ncbi:MAG: DUF47 domain-containing protein [Acetanaerobacterium sp.]
MARKKDNDYFALFVEMADYSCQAARGLNEALNDFEPDALPERMRCLHHIEHTADLAKHDMMSRLVKAFFAPLEREDIMLLAQQLDDVTDAVEDVLIHIYMYNIRTIPAEALEFSETIMQCCDELKRLMQEFYNFRRSQTIHEHLVRINYLEEVGDRLYTEAVRTLYTTGHTAMEITGWTETFDRMEKCCDACENVADVVESVIMKNA